MFRLIASCVRPLRFNLSVLTLTFLLAPIAAQAQAPGTCDGMSLGTTATSGTVGGNLNGFVPFLESNAWNTNVSSAATDPNSAAIVASWTQTIPILGTEPDTLTVNFGSDTNAATGIPQNGIPYIVVDSTVTPLQSIDVYGADASKDDVVVAPFPNTAGSVPIGGSATATEGTPTYYGGNADCDGWPESPAVGDNLALVLDRATCWLYETSGTTGCNGQYEAVSETIWDMANGESRPWGWPSADTSGLPVFPGLVRYDEVNAGAINHALAFTMSPTLGDSHNGYFVLPASYAASTTTTAHLLPTGARIRLKPSFNISSFTAANQVILTAMQQYGMILTDTGANFSVQGTPDARWDDTDLQNWAPNGELAIGIYALEGTGPTLANFEVVQMSPEYKGMDDVSAYTSTNPEYAAGHAIPVIDDFGANGKTSFLTITAGTPVTFNYTVTGDSYDYIDNIGPVRLTSGTGSVTITPMTTQVYTLYSTNAWGRASSSMTISVSGSVVTPPVFNPSPAQTGILNAAQKVAISTPTSSEAKIYYTTDGTTPTTASTLFAGSVTVDSTCATTHTGSETLEAIATVTGYAAPSAASTATYTCGGKTATPTFSPGSGTYEGTQTVTISDATGGASIYYTTDGTAPTSASTLYSAAITVAVTQTVEAIAESAGNSNSTVATARYTINPPAAATPTFAPPAGTYTSVQTVTISDTQPSSSIYYTTGFGTPTTNSTLYTGPITVNATATIKAIDVASGFSNSAVASATYTINLPPAATPTFAPPAGTYTSIQSVTISDATGGAAIYYTTNGGVPTTNSTLYTTPVTVAVTQTLRAIAVLAGDANSAVGSAAYTINLPAAATPTFSPTAGSYSSTQTVTINDATGGVTIYYTVTAGTTGTAPTTNSSVYSTPLSVANTEVIEAIAVETGFSNSTVATAKYTITDGTTVATPTFTPPAGTYSATSAPPAPLSVTISSTTPSSNIYYTTDGTTPTYPVGGTTHLYGGALTISATTTVKAIGQLTGDNNSPVATAIYTLAAAATPTFSPVAGTYTTIQTVTISDTAGGASIYYTTNGTAPTTNSTLYSTPITVSVTQTLRAIAVLSGDSNSAVGSAAYTINDVVATPTFAPAANFPYISPFTAPQTVTISDTTAGSTIYYTTDGTAPTTASALYSGPITVSNPTPEGSVEVEALAVKTGLLNSTVGTVTYYFDIGSVGAPTFSPGTGVYSGAQTVTLSDATAGVTIYYTITTGTTGTTPTTASSTYSVPITVTPPSVVEAFAAKSGYANSSVVSATYSAATPAPTPNFSPASGTYQVAQYVSIGDGAPSATIYYTTNGTAPTTASPQYTGLPIKVVGSATPTVIEAIATANSYTQSAVGSATYTIPIPAQLTIPTPGTQLTGTTVTFGWTPGSASTHFELWLGTTGAGSTNLYNSGSVTATSETVTNLPSNGETVYARLYFYVYGTWQESDYTYTAFGSPQLPYIEMPVPSTQIPGSTALFTWNPGNVATEFELFVGTTGVGSSNIYSSGYVTATSESVSGIPANGETVYARLWWLVSGTWSSADYTYTTTGSITPAALTTPVPGTQLTGTSVTFGWTPGNTATHFELLLGTNGVGTSNLYNTGSVTATSATVGGLPSNGETVYARLYWMVNNGWKSADYTYTASGSATPAALTTPTPGSKLGGTQVAFSWNPGNRATEFQLFLGTTGVGSNNLYNSGAVTTTTETVSGLPNNGEEVYARLYWYISGTWHSADYTYTAAGSVVAPALTTPAPSTKLTGTSVTFGWTPGNIATEYELLLGTQGVGASNLYSSGAVTTTSETVGNLPDNGEPVYARLYSFYNGAWHATDYTYTAAGSPVLPTLSTPTPSSTLTGTSVTFTWNPGNAATNFELWVGNTAVGSSNIYNSNSVTVTSETVSGLPSNGEPVYVRLYYYLNGAWSYESYTYTATGSPTLPVLTTPTPSTTLTGTSVAFSWSPGNAATTFELLVGTTGVGSGNLYNSNSVTVTTETVSDLPNNGVPVYVRLYWYLNGAWNHADYRYTAF